MIPSVCEQIFLMTPAETSPPVLDFDPQNEISLGELFGSLAARWRLIAVATILSGGAAFGIAMALPPIYTAQTVIMPPQQQGGAMSAALGSLGALAGLAGGSVKSSADQYVALMTSVTVSDRIIDAFDLMKVYEQDYRSDTRKILSKTVLINAGKKDGLITIEVDDKDPKRAAAMANAYVDGLRYMTSNLAVSEAQQRRIFFETKLGETKEKLTQAQIALQASGFNPGAIKTEPKAAAEAYARVQAEVTAAEVKLKSLRSMLADSASEVVQQQALLSALRGQLDRIERSSQPASESADYITRYREFKYQETLFELFARQYENARLDESREGTLIQVVDPAAVPDKKSKPKRAFIVLGGVVAGFLLSSLWVLMRRLRAAP